MSIMGPAWDGVCVCSFRKNRNQGINYITIIMIIISDSFVALLARAQQCALQTFFL